MKRFISIITVMCLVLACGVLFSSCKDDETNGQGVEKYTTTTTVKKDASEDTEDGVVKQTVIFDVTDKEGNSQTSIAEYSVMGGSDPYVEDIF